MSVHNTRIGETVTAKYYNTDSIMITSEATGLQTELVRQGNIFPVSMEMPGIYTVTAGEEQYAVSFLFLSDEESDLRGLSSFIPEETEDLQVNDKTKSEQTGWLLLLHSTADF